MQKQRIILMTLSLALAGCASRPKLDPHTDWNSRVGSYTYDQAVAELGKPDAISESNEGKTADWILKRGSQVSFGFGVARESTGRIPLLGLAWALPFRRRRTENTCT
jgi:hypothetical protein